MNLSNVMVTGGTFNHTSYTSISRGIDRLREASAPGALYNSGERYDPPKCHPNTRVAVIEKLMDFITGHFGVDELIMWLYGPVGSGKSAIAQTLAELCAREGRLLATFFFSKNAAGRNIARPLMATIAYQVALAIPEARNFIDGAVERNPMIFDQSLETQFSSLVLDPLRQLADAGFSFECIPTLVIIDGLDECQNRDLQCYIVKTISNGLRQAGLNLRFLIASRPEPHLQIIFNSPSLQSTSCRLILDNSYSPSDDISLFLQDSFDDIKRTHPLAQLISPSWPTSDLVRMIVSKSSNQFVYASTVIKYIGSIYHQPMTRLDGILGIKPQKGGKDLPFAELDALYIHLLSSVEDIERTMQVLGVLFVLEPLSKIVQRAEEIDRFLFWDEGVTRSCLSCLASVIQCHPAGRTLVLHASLSEFLLDPRRSQQFHLSSEQVLSNFLCFCLRHFRENEERTHLMNSVLLKNLLICTEGAKLIPDVEQELRGFSFITAYQGCADTCLNDMCRYFAEPFLTIVLKRFGGDLHFQYLSQLPNLFHFVIHQYPFKATALRLLAAYSIHLADPPKKGTFYQYGDTDLSDWHMGFRPEYCHLLVVDEDTSRFDQFFGLDFLENMMRFTGLVPAVEAQGLDLAFISSMPPLVHDVTDPNNYVSTALVCFEYLCSNAPSVSVSHKRFSECTDVERIRIKALLHGLYIFPRALVRAARSVELVDRLQTSDFRLKFLINGWNDEGVEAANKAIAAYLELYGSDDSVAQSADIRKTEGIENGGYQELSSGNGTEHPLTDRASNNRENDSAPNDASSSNEGPIHNPMTGDSDSIGSSMDQSYLITSDKQAREINPNSFILLVALLPVFFALFWQFFVRSPEYSDN